MSFLILALLLSSITAPPQTRTQTARPAAARTASDIFTFPRFGNRAATFDDFVPVLPMSLLSNFGLEENWWYHASLRGSDGHDYVIRFAFDHSGTPEGGLRFALLGPPDKELTKPMLSCDFTSEKIEVDVAARTTRFHHTGSGCQIDTQISQTSGTTINVTAGGSRIELNFRSRGFPIPYDSVITPHAGAFVSGFEDLSEAAGSALLNGTKLSFKGRGTQERIRFSKSWLSVEAHPIISNNDWFIIHTDTVYMLVNRSRDNRNLVTTGAGIMNGTLFETAHGKDVSIDMDQTVNEWPKWVHIKIQTTGGTYELTGKLQGKADQYPLGPGYIHYPVYDFTGTMVRNNKTTQLTNGTGWLELRRYIPGPF